MAAVFRAVRMTEPYEYTGLVAEAWDLLRGDTSAWPDRPFYRGLIASQNEHCSGPALDVGCGTGRLLLDYLAAGLDIDGVDNSPEMLALCRSKAAASGLEVSARLFEQEMHALALPRRYATVMVPSSSFQLLTREADAAEALQRFYGQLRPGGLLVMSIMSKLWPGKQAPVQMEWTKWFRAGEQIRPQDGRTICRWIRTCYDYDLQLEHEENRYEVVANGTVMHSELHCRSPAVRWYSQAQIMATYERAGFVDVRTTSGFTMAPAAAEDTTFCVLGQRAD